MEFDALQEAMAAGKEQAESVLTGSENIPVNDDIDMDQLKKLMENFQKEINANANPSAVAGIGMGIHWGIYFVAFILLAGFVGFFAYKLIHNLREKERKQKEKKRLKELKKKK